MENLTGGTPPVRPLPCVVPCKLYFINIAIFVPFVKVFDKQTIEEDEKTLQEAE